MLMEPEVLATKWHRWEATFRSVYNPPEVGDWSFVSTCSHRDNHGLHEQRGSFNCAESRRADTLPAARPHPALSYEPAFPHLREGIADYIHTYRQYLAETGG